MTAQPTLTEAVRAVVRAAIAGWPVSFKSIDEQADDAMKKLGPYIDAAEVMRKERGQVRRMRINYDEDTITRVPDPYDTARAALMADET